MTTSTAAPSAWAAISGLSSAAELRLDSRDEREQIADVDRGTFMWDAPMVFKVTFDTPDGPGAFSWSAEHVAHYGWELRRNAERGEAWNIKVTGPEITSSRQFWCPTASAAAQTVDWTDAFAPFHDWAGPTTGTPRPMREIDLGAVDTDEVTGKRLETFVISYEQLQSDGGWARLKRALPRRGIEFVGRVAAYTARRMPEKFRNVAVHDMNGSDVTFDFAFARTGV